MLYLYPCLPYILNMGNSSLFTSPGSNSFSHPRGLQHCSTRGINTPPFPAPVPDILEVQGEAVDHRGLSV